MREDIRAFKKEHGLERVAMVNCASTEAYAQPQKAHFDPEELEAALERSDPSVSPAMAYAYAAVMEDVAYANGAPFMAVDIPALLDAADERGMPVAGKDLKTGQTLTETIVAPGLEARMLGLEGWYSTNILGNRDGEVLDDPESPKGKEVTSSRCWSTSCSPRYTPSSTKTSRTSPRSTTARPVATPRRAGTP